jgi:hypothetical protein
LIWIKHLCIPAPLAPGLRVAVARMGTPGRAGPDVRFMVSLMRSHQWRKSLQFAYTPVGERCTHFGLPALFARFVLRSWWSVYFSRRAE